MTNPAGARLEYSNMAISETWTAERDRISIKITDSLSGRSRAMICEISNPKNSKDSIYVPYLRVRVIESRTGLVIFLGRIEASENFENNQGIYVHRITARDYSQDLLMQAVDKDYSKSYSYFDYPAGAGTDDPSDANLIFNSTPGYFAGITAGSDIEIRSGSDTAVGWYIVTAIDTINHKYLLLSTPCRTAATAVTDINFRAYSAVYTPMLRSDLISQIAFDYSFLGNLDVISGILPSTTGTEVLRDFTKSGKSPMQIINELASEEPWDSTPTPAGYGYDFYVDDAQILRYFKRGTIFSGLSVIFGVAQSASIKSMLPGYTFSTQPNELVTKVTCYGTDSDGVEQYGVAENTAAESTYKVVRERVAYIGGTSMDGTTLVEYLTNKANSLLNSDQPIVTRGEFQIVGYPIYGDTPTLVRVGEKIYIECAPLGIADWFLITEVLYSEPDGLSTIQVLLDCTARTHSPLDLNSILTELKNNANQSVTSARLGDLLIGDTQINNISISKLITGSLNAKAVILSGAGAVVSDFPSTARVEFTHKGLEAYDATSTRHFFVNAATGYMEEPTSGGGLTRISGDSAPALGGNLNASGRIIFFMSHEKIYNFADTLNIYNLSGAVNILGTGTTALQIGSLHGTATMVASSGYGVTIGAGGGGISPEINDLRLETGAGSGDIVLLPNSGFSYLGKGRLTGALDTRGYNIYCKSGASLNITAGASGDGAVAYINSLNLSAYAGSGDVIIRPNSGFTYIYNGRLNGSDLNTFSYGIYSNSGYGLSITAGISGGVSYPITNDLRLTTKEGSGNIIINPNSGFTHIYNGKLATNINLNTYNLNTISGYGITIAAGKVGTTTDATNLRLESLKDIYLNANSGNIFIQNASGYTYINNPRIYGGLDLYGSTLKDSYTGSVAVNNPSYTLTYSTHYIGSTYTNSTKLRFVMASINVYYNEIVTAYVYYSGGLKNVGEIYNSYNGTYEMTMQLCFFVPPGATYELDSTDVHSTVERWAEIDLF